MRTYQQKTAEAKHDWYIVDAAGQRLGTLAVRIARTLSGKHKPTWTPHIDDGDFVVVVNAEKVELGGNKWRAIKMFEGDKVNAPGLKKLLVAAVALNGKKGKAKASPKKKPKSKRAVR